MDGCHSNMTCPITGISQPDQENVISNVSVEYKSLSLIIYSNIILCA